MCVRVKSRLVCNQKPSGHLVMVEVDEEDKWHVTVKKTKTQSVTEKRVSSSLTGVIYPNRFKNKISWRTINSFTSVDAHKKHKIILKVKSGTFINHPYVFIMKKIFFFCVCVKIL